MTRAPSFGVSVRELARFAWRTGDLGAEAGAISSAAKGTAAHKKHQAGRGAEYRAEVSLSLEVNGGDIALLIAGRADGVIEGDGATAVEEIKTVATPLLLLPPDGAALHWAQAELYAAMLAKERGLEAVDVRLAYVHCETGQARTFRRARSREQLDAFWERTLEIYLEWLRLVVAHRRRRDASLPGLRLPYAAFRPGQRELAKEVARAARLNEPLFAQAPTGGGKTMGVLLGAIEAIAHEPSTIVFFLTSRDTQKAAALGALADIAATGVSLSVLVLTSRERACPHPEAGCRPTECPLAAGHFDRLRAAAADLFEARMITREAAAAVAARHRVCPHDLAFELVPWVDVVVCDLSYAFDPRVGGRVADGLASRRVLYLVDEAHNLVDRAREMFSFGLSIAQVRAVKAEIGEEARSLSPLLDDLDLRIREAVTRALEAQARGEAVKELPPGLVRAAGEYCEAAGALMNERPSVRRLASVRELFFEAHAFGRAADRLGEGHCVLSTTGESDRRIELFCADPSHELERAVGEDATAIFFSATLSPMAYFRRLLSRAARHRVVIQPSSFPERNLCVAVADGVSVALRDRRASVPTVTALAAAFVGAREGNYIIYLPSYDYLDAVRDAFSSAVPGVRIVSQDRAMNDARREGFLAAFTPNPTGTTVGFAVLGGVFAEGIDLVGERLSGAVIVSVGLPAIEPRRELLRARFGEQHEDGFSFAYAFPGMIKVLQAAGRVVRSAEDRGAVLLVDRRFSSPPYRELLSCWPQRRAVEGPKDLGALLARFWTEKNSSSPRSEVDKRTSRA